MNSTLSSLSRSTESPDRRSRFPAWMIPAGLLLGFSILLAIFFREQLWPARKVEVAAVLATPAHPSEEGEFISNSTVVAFQASGWVEPDPLPIEATALVDGVIDEVLVLEGEMVQKGQAIATLIREDYELALRAAEQELSMSKAELHAHRQSIEAGKRRVLATQAELDASGVLVSETQDRLNRVKGLSRGTVSEFEVIAIESAYRRAKAAERASEAALGQAEAQLSQLEAAFVVIEHRIRVADVRVDEAKLALSRTTITAPIDGLILRLLAAPGQKKMLAMDDMESATVAVLFDPSHLQVRVDVPLADASQLQLAQKVRIRCSLLPDQVFEGEVTRINGQADIQRNTLQVKVRIDEPDSRLRPDMLCRAEFLQSQRGGQAKDVSRVATWVPSESLEIDRVWVCDPESKRVESREVVPSKEREDGYVRVSEGLNPGEWVVMSPKGLTRNQRVKPSLLRP